LRIYYLTQNKDNRFSHKKTDADGEFHCWLVPGIIQRERGVSDFLVSVSVLIDLTQLDWFRSSQSSLTTCRFLKAMQTQPVPK